MSTKGSEYGSHTKTWWLGKWSLQSYLSGLTHFLVFLEFFFLKEEITRKSSLLRQFMCFCSLVTEREKVSRIAQHGAFYWLFNDRYLIKTFKEIHSFLLNFSICLLAKVISQFSSLCQGKENKLHGYFFVHLKWMTVSKSLLFFQEELPIAAYARFWENALREMIV